MQKTLSVFALFSLTMLLAIVSCKKDESNQDFTSGADCTAIDPAQNTYNNVVGPILDDKCATSGCHNATTAADGVDLSNYDKVKIAFESKEALCTIHHGSGCRPMPEGGSKLDDATINLIDCWVKNGYAE